MVFTIQTIFFFGRERRKFILELTKLFVVIQSRFYRHDLGKPQINLIKKNCMDQLICFYNLERTIKILHSQKSYSAPFLPIYCIKTHVSVSHILNDIPFCYCNSFSYTVHKKKNSQNSNRILNLHEKKNHVKSFAVFIPIMLLYFIQPMNVKRIESTSRWI